MPNVLRSLVLLLLPLSVFGQSIEWLAATSGTGQHNFFSIDKDEAEGAIYAVGSFVDELDQVYADPLALEADGIELSLTSAGGEDFLFSKFSIDAELLWSVTGGSSDDDAFLSVAVNENGSIWVGGYVRGDFTFSTPQGDQDIDTNGGRRKAVYYKC